MAKTKTINEKRGFRGTRPDLGGPLPELGPAESAEATYSRSARKHNLYLYRSSALCLQHGCARKGLAVFNRSAHSAGPGQDHIDKNVFLIKRLLLHRIRPNLIHLGPEGRKSNALYHWVSWILFPCFIGILPKNVFL